MKSILAITFMASLLCLCAAEGAGAGGPGPASGILITRSETPLLSSALRMLAAAPRFGKSLVGRSKQEEKSSSPVRTYRPVTRPSYTPPAPKPSPSRSAKPFIPPKPQRPSTPSIKTAPRPSRTTLPQRSTPSFPVRTTSSPRPSRPSGTAAASTRATRPFIPAPPRITGTTRTATRPSSAPTLTPRTGTTPRIRSTRPLSGTTTTSASSRATRPGFSGFTRLPGIVGRRSVSTTSRTATTSTSPGGRQNIPYISTRNARGDAGTSTRFSRGHAGTSRFSRGHAGAYVTSRYSRGHAGAYVTSRYSRGHAGAYVTSRYSRGHAGAYVTGRYSRGHLIGTYQSRWIDRSQRLRRYTRPYHYYGRQSRYYFCLGRWLPLPPGHIHGPGCGHVFRYGRWYAMGAVAYPVFVPIPDWGYYYYDGGWHPEAPIYVEEEEIVLPPPEEAEPQQAPEYLSLQTKAERDSVLLTRTYDLDWWQAKRVEDLISKGIIESVLAGGEAGESSRMVFDRTKQKLSLTGTPDDLLRIRTIIDDDGTYKLFTQEDLGGLVVDAVPLVDLRFVESDPSTALRVAADNYSGADEILRSSESAPSGREWWFNQRIGTMTVKNSVENLDALYEFLETRPYLR